jgi:hypothetical protein
MRERADAGNLAARTAPHSAHVWSRLALTATTRGSAVKVALSSVLSRLITCSGQAAAQAPHAVQRAASRIRQRDPESSRPEMMAPVGQTPTHTSQKEQPPASISRRPRGQPGPSTAQGARPRSLAPRAASASVVASGSRSSMQSGPGNSAGSSQLLASSAWSCAGPGRPSAAAKSPMKLSRSPARSAHNLSSQLTSRTATPARKIWRSHPALTISKDGMRRARNSSPTSGPLPACWHVIATPPARLVRRTDRTSTAAAAPIASKSASARATALSGQATTQLPQPVQRSPSTNTRPDARRKASCLQARRQATQPAPLQQRSSSQVAIGRRARSKPRNNDRRDMAPTEKLARSVVRTVRSALATRAAAAHNKAALWPTTSASPQSAPVRRSTMSVPPMPTPARRKAAKRSARACEAFRHPITTGRD